MLSECGYLIVILVFVPYIESANRLNEYIRHYETLNYNTHEIHKNHERVRRSVVRDQHVHLQLRSHGRTFNIRMKRDLDVFSDNVVIEDSDGNVLNTDTSHLYHGYLIGEPKSHVFGSVIDGVFEGKIQTSSQDAYYVEKVTRYFPKHANQSFHSVIYKEADITDPYETNRRGHFSGCGITQDIINKMEKIQNSAVEIEEEAENNEVENVVQNKETEDDDDEDKRINLELEMPHKKYTREMNNYSSQVLANNINNNNNNSERSSRSRRGTRTKEDNKNTCSLFIQTDPLIWRHISETVNNDKEKTREEILSLIAHHVTAVNYIYRDTKFDGRSEHRNIKFEVQRIKIDDDSPCHPEYNGEPNPFCMENIDVSNFLNLHSLGNHEDFCLAYVFTYRDFTGGTLGLAWVASASGASGGICEKYKTYTETVGGMYQSTKRSLNTGIITFVNYNTRVPPKVSQLTLAHEIGHNFGSPHDYPSECRPGGLNGNYIMFASATSGDRPNNSKFSSCSVGNISNVLDAIQESKKRNCFTASAGAFCGNKIVEAGEECDCGYDDEECNDHCCYPRLLSERDRQNNITARGCARRRGTACSPSEGPCCSSQTCDFIPNHHAVKCRSESDCSWSSTCNGRSPTCPLPSPKANKTRCNEGTQLCINGECTGSICLEWNLTECFLTSHIIPNIDKRRLCELACQNGTDPATCRSTSEFAHLVGLPDGGISLRPGSPCDNFQGYCDVFFKCRAVDAEGPLARLKNLLFNKETLSTVAQWVTEYWWAVLLMGLAFIVFMGMFIKCCAVHTPSSNPKKPPAVRLSETLRRPMTTLRRMRRPQGSSGSGSGASSRPGPHHGYGANRGQYYAPKGRPPPQGYSRSNHQELYAGAYDNRNAFEMRHHNKV